MLRALPLARRLGLLALLVGNPQAVQTAQEVFTAWAKFSAWATFPARPALSTQAASSAKPHRPVPQQEERGQSHHWPTKMGIDPPEKLTSPRLTRGHFNSLLPSFFQTELTLYELDTTQHDLLIGFFLFYLVLTKVWLLVLSPPGRLAKRRAEAVSVGPISGARVGPSLATRRPAAAAGARVPSSPTGRPVAVAPGVRSATDGQP